MNPLLDVADLYAGYGRIPVLFGVDLTVAEGEIVALLGANGAGKTTTLRTVSGLLVPRQGTIAFAGERIDGRPAERIARRGLVHVPEGRGVFPSLGVEETLRLAGKGVSRPELEARLERVYAVFPVLAQRRRQPVGTLSGGQRQMVAISRGLLGNPRLLIIDELSQGLAPAVCDELFAVLAGFPAQGTAVLLVEQFVSRALELADRAYVLAKGRVSFSGPAARLAADDEFMAGAYLGHGEVGDETAALAAVGEGR
jgi:branched-chain amino acid transport system ATP-binding protein